MSEPAIMDWRSGTRLSVYFDNEEAFYFCIERNMKHLERAELPLNQKQVDLWCEDSSLTLLHNLFKQRYRYRVEYRSGSIFSGNGPVKRAVEKLRSAGYQLYEDYHYDQGHFKDTLYLLDRNMATMVRLADESNILSFEKVITYPELENEHG
jgi:hypothetical protein